MAGCIGGVSMREAHEETGSGTARKGKALLVDCDVVHSGNERVNQFTTDATGGGWPRRSSYRRLNSAAKTGRCNHWWLILTLERMRGRLIQMNSTTGLLFLDKLFE